MARTLEDLNCCERLYFRDQFRVARAQALSDAEGYEVILFALESLGVHLCRKRMDLGRYKDAIVNLTQQSFLERDDVTVRDWQISFPKLYELVRLGRNDAMHQGAAARNLTAQAVELAIRLEDALVTNLSTIDCFMVRNTLCALPWQPLSFVRQAMLENSFSYLPVYFSDGEQKGWHLISDHAVATCVRASDGVSLLGIPIKEVVESKRLKLESVKVCEPTTTIQEALDLTGGQPLLVCEKDNPDHLLGILTPFDLL